MLKILSAATLALCVFATPALAQLPKIFLASTGADTNDGSRTSPKRSLQAGHDAVAAGGEVVILDTAGYGVLKITKSVGVVVPPGVNGFITVPGTGNVRGVDIAAGANDIVTLRGLIVEGTDTSSNTGIYVSSAGKVILEDTTVRNFYDGVFVNVYAPTQFVMRGGAVRNAFYGIDVESASSSATVNAIVSDVEITGSHFGIYAYSLGTGSSPIVTVTATRAIISGSSTGAYLASSFTRIILDACTITGNSTPFNSSSIYSRGNNTVVNNTNAGITPTPLAGQ